MRTLAATNPQTQLQMIRRRIFAEGEISSTAGLPLDGAAFGAGLGGVATADTGAFVEVGVAASPAFAITETSLAGFRDS
ncbi:MAG: hypothetical protein ACLQVG_07560 [Terriglobia bacterium]